MMGRPDNGIVSHRIIVRTMEIMSPFIDVVRSGFDDYRPETALFDIGHAVRREHAHDLIHCHFQRFLADQQVDEIVGIRQIIRFPRLDRHFAVKTQRLNVFSCLFDVFSVSIQAVNKVTIIRIECRREFSVAAADMDDKPALNASVFKNLPGLLLKCCLSTCRW